MPMRPVGTAAEDPRLRRNKQEKPISHDARRRKGSPVRAATLGSHGPHARPCPDDRHARAGAHSGTIPFRRMRPMRNFRRSRAKTRPLSGTHRQDHHRAGGRNGAMAAAVGQGCRRRRNRAGQRSHRPSLPWHQPLRPRDVAARFRIQRPALVQLSPGGRARLAGPQGRKGDAGLFLQADRDRGQNG